MNRKPRLPTHMLPLFATAAWASTALVSAQAQSTARPISHIVHCTDQRSFVVELSGEEASVRVGEQLLHLHRQRSGSLNRYSSPDAALVIDGDYVAFVMANELDFNGCHLAGAGAEEAAVMTRSGSVPR